MEGITIYESEAMRKTAGNLLRPGGLFLTQRGCERAAFQRGDRVLDIGCGLGTTVHYLAEHLGMEAVGIDPSTGLLAEGRQKYGSIQLKAGRGEALPFADFSLEGVLNECTLSLMEDRKRAMAEVRRVLVPEGRWVITDLYARAPQWLSGLEAGKIKSCIRGLFSLDRLSAELKAAGFQIRCLEDHTPLLKELLVNLLFTHGSLAAFWAQVASLCAADAQALDQQLNRCKPGYFLLVAEKI